MDVENPKELPQQPRENMISTAIRFLQNPKVVESPLGQKRVFLEKKGLTSEEIDLAISRARVQDNPGPAQVPTSYPSQPIQAPVSLWTKFKDYTSSAIIFAALSYGLYKFFQKYIRPLLYGESAEEKQLAALQKSIKELQFSINDTVKCMKEVQNSVNTQYSRLDDLSINKPTEDRSYVKEIKDEIKSLKGLMLSRKQFPPTPASQPVLPAWQLVSPKTDEKPSTQQEPANDTQTEITVNGEVQPSLVPSRSSAENLMSLPIINGLTDAELVKDNYPVVNNISEDSIMDKSTTENTTTSSANSVQPPPETSSIISTEHVQVHKSASDEN